MTVLPTDKSGGLFSLARWAGTKPHETCAPVKFRIFPLVLPQVEALGVNLISDFELRIYLSCPQNRTARRDASNDYGDCGDYGDCSDYGD